MKCPKCGAENHDGAISCSLCCTPFNAPAQPASVYRAEEEKAKSVKQPLVKVTGALFGSAFILTLLPLDLIPYIFFKGPRDERYDLQTSWYIFLAAVGAFGGVVQHFFDSIDTAYRFFLSLGAALAGVVLAFGIHGFILTDHGFKVLDRLSSGKDVEEDSGPEPELQFREELIAAEYTDEQSGFSIQPPDGWSERDGFSEIRIIFEGDEIDGIIPYMDVIFMSDTDKMTDYYSPSRKKLNEIFFDFKLVDETACTVDGKDALRLVFTTGRQGLKSKGMAVIIDCKTFKWVIAGVAPVKRYNEFANTIYSSINSFKTLK